MKLRGINRFSISAYWGIITNLKTMATNAVQLCQWKSLKIQNQGGPSNGIQIKAKGW